MCLSTNFKYSILALIILFNTIFSCHQTSELVTGSLTNEQKALFELLDEGTPVYNEQRFGIINQIAQTMFSNTNKNDLILFLTQYVEKNPDDPYDAYWLLLTAYIYQQIEQQPISAYYYKRILNNYQDLLYQDQSIHFLCLKNLIELTSSPEEKSQYCLQLIANFPDKINKTKAYFMLAKTYEDLGEWELGLQTYNNFLASEDSATIQIPGYPDAFSYARKLVALNNSPKDWTFKTLDELVDAIRNGFNERNARILNKYRTKVNFFAMSWTQENLDYNKKETDFTLEEFMAGNTIRCAPVLDASSTPTEAYLKTWGWERGRSTWYLYFRKIHFPADPDIHGQWEWAGIYYGEKI